MADAIVMLYGLANSNTIGAIEFDAVLSEDFQGRAEATAHPVEYGPSVSDHIRPEPRALEIVGVISDFPIRPASDVAMSWVSREVERLKSWETMKRLASLGGPLGALLPDPARPSPPRIPHFEQGRSLAAFAELERLRQEAQIVRVITGLGEYDRLAITGVSTRRDAASSSSLTIRVSLQEIRLAVAMRRGLPDDLLRKDQGKQVARPAPPATADKAREARNRSLLHRGAGLLGNVD